MARFCTNCGVQLPENANNCPNCGKAVAQPAGGGVAASSAETGGLTDDMAGLLAYVTVIPAIIFLLIEPYSRNRFVRFHAFQSIFFCVAWLVLWAALSFVAAIPFLGWATLLLWPLLGFGGLILWILMMVKAYCGQMWKVPVIGDMAETQANA